MKTNVFITGSSRGIGAATALLAGADKSHVFVNFRDKETRALKIAEQIIELGGSAEAIKLDITDSSERGEVLEYLKINGFELDVLVLNASGGMEKNRGDDYANILNRDSQLAMAKEFSSVIKPGGRIVFVTSHQAHFINSVPTMPEYVEVAKSKKAGENALRDFSVELKKSKNIDFVVVSGDMIVGTITATLLNRLNPGAIAEREKAAGKLYDVEEFALEIYKSFYSDIPENKTIYIGSIDSFVG